MNALINAHTLRDRSRSPYAGLTSSVLPEVQRSHTGVSSDYVQKQITNGSCCELHTTEHRKSTYWQQRIIMKKHFTCFL